jgi:hypothetical protein
LVFEGLFLMLYLQQQTKDVFSSSLAQICTRGTHGQKSLVLRRFIRA